MAGNCKTGGTFADSGCSAGDYTYNLTVETSDVTFGSVVFWVENPNGSVFVATGGTPGFSVLNSTGVIVAQYASVGGVMSMGSGWTYTDGTHSSTPLTSLHTILIDMGTANPSAASR